LKHLIIGLGNPGKQYIRTRHNAGFIILDLLSYFYKIDFIERKKGFVAKKEIQGSQVTFVKPNTFMNLSGSAVSFWAKKLNIKQSNILIILDDISLPFGKIRLREQGSAGGHNGLIDIFHYYNDKKISRLKFGIGKDFRFGGQSEYVLSNFSKKEFSFFDSNSDNFVNIIEKFIDCGINETMNTYNS